MSEDFTTKILNWKIEKESAPISAIRQIILLENKSFSFFKFWRKWILTKLRLIRDKNSL